MSLHQLVHGDRGRDGDVEAGDGAVVRDGDDVVGLFQKCCGQALAFVADDQGGLIRETEAVDRDGAFGDFQGDDVVAAFAQLPDGLVRVGDVFDPGLLFQSAREGLAALAEGPGQRLPGDDHRVAAVGDVTADDHADVLRTGQGVQDGAELPVWQVCGCLSRGHWSPVED